MPHTPSLRPTTARLALALWLALGWAACAPEPEPETPDAWHRVDLWTATPTVEFARLGSEVTRQRPYQAKIDFLGMAEVRDMGRVPEAQLVTFPRRTAGQIRALEQVADSRLSYPVDLGADPWVSFIPLGFVDKPCPCTYRFGLRDARGGLHELYRTRVEEVTPIARGAVEIPLTDFAESTVELLFQVEPDAPTSPGAKLTGPKLTGPPPTALWGSPAVYSRRPAVSWRSRTAKKPPNVLLVAADTLRLDAVGTYQDPARLETSRTPALDRLAEEADVWTQAVATFNNTNPSFASIFTGLYGKNHGVYDLQTPLPPAHTTLAEVFDGAGYDTLAVISASHLGDHNSGLAQGFDEVVTASHHFAGELPVDMAMDWMAQREAPFFAWIHLFDVHTPHTPPEPYAAGFRPTEPTGLSPIPGWTPYRRPGSRPFTEPVLGGNPELYQGEVAYLDRQVDRLLGFLRSRDLLEDTLLVFVADHGENLGEHGINSRHIGLWETTVRVPLMIRWPGEAGTGRRFDGPVQTVDLYPTLLAAAGLEAPESDGVDLQQLTFDGRRGRRATFAEHAGGTDVMVRTRTHKYFESQGNPEVAPGPHLYDLTTDPGELTNLAGRGLPVEAELRALLDAWRADRRPAPETTQRQLSPEEEEKLRALGYL